MQKRSILKLDYMENIAFISHNKLTINVAFYG